MEQLLISGAPPAWYTHTHTHTHTQICTYSYMCVKVLTLVHVI